MNSTGFSKKFENLKLSKEEFISILSKFEDATIISKKSKNETSITVFDLEGGKVTFSSLAEFVRSNPEYESISTVMAKFSSYTYSKKKIELVEHRMSDTNLHLNTPYSGLEVSANVTTPTSKYYELLNALDKLNSKKYKTNNALPHNMLLSTVFSVLAAFLFTLICSNFIHKIGAKSLVASILFGVYIVAYFLIMVLTYYLGKKYKSIVLVSGTSKSGRIFKEDMKYWVGYIMTNVILQLLISRVLRG